MATNLTPQEGAALKHWSTYGQPGNLPTKRVTASDWKTKPFQQPITSTWKVEIKPSDLSPLLNGFLPLDMNDKWFIYADGPGSSGHACLHFFRSWTGTKIAEVILQTREVNEEGAEAAVAEITSLVWESSQKVVGMQDERSVKEMVRKVCGWVFNVELPSDKSDPGVN